MKDKNKVRVLFLNIDGEVNCYLEDLKDIFDIHSLIKWVSVYPERELSITVTNKPHLYSNTLNIISRVYDPTNFTYQYVIKADDIDTERERKEFYRKQFEKLQEMKERGEF